ncbi:MAG TPA: sugar phosphate isomerase/epimerase family protein [Phycisphaerae bacterium]|nr:sugar phosphate isomerase/epimerase family protein [Phycisphaerae bacterium]
MNVSLAIESVENAEALAQTAHVAARAGFQGLELPVGASGLLSLDTPPAECHEICRRVVDAGLGISALSLRRSAEDPHLASSDAADRRRAQERVIAALDRAGWLNTSLLVFAPVVLGAPEARYEEAYGRAVEGLLALRFEAQQRGVHIACAIRDTRFLLSPTEARTFIDRVNSPFVGLSLDIGSLLAFGYPEDWIASLGHRAFHVYLTDHCRGKLANPAGIGEGDGDWPTVVGALRAARYTGPLTVPPSNDPLESFGKAIRILGEPAK